MFIDREDEVQVEIESRHLDEPIVRYDGRNVWNPGAQVTLGLDATMDSSRSIMLLSILMRLLSILEGNRFEDPVSAAVNPVCTCGLENFRLSHPNPRTALRVADPPFVVQLWPCIRPGWLPCIPQALVLP